MEIQDTFLWPVAFHFASGAAFFTGIALLTAGLLIPGKTKRWLNALRRLLVLLGAFGIALSATPISLILYGVWALAIVTALFLRDSKSFKRWANPITALAVAMGLFSALIELPHHFLRPLSGRYASLYVLGDSVTAGLGTKGETLWPGLLASERGVKVTSYARAGATAESALDQARRLPEDADLVVLEIGGNDLLGQESTEEFASHLRTLLSAISKPGRRLVMLELPLPPFKNGYGQVQRQFAHEFNILLVPKRYFAGILAAPGATQDGIHLSNDGHRRMAALIWNVLDGALAPNPAARP